MNPFVWLLLSSDDNSNVSMCENVNENQLFPKLVAFILSIRPLEGDPLAVNYSDTKLYRYTSLWVTAIFLLAFCGQWIYKTFKLRR